MYIDLLNKIYKMIQSGIVITRESLNDNDITNTQIDSLLTADLIYETHAGTYNLVSVNQLFAYGKENLIQGNKRTAQEVFELCYKIKPRHRDTCLQLFCHAIITRNYEEAYQYLDALEHVGTNEHLRKDYKVYLYLLSQISPVPDFYQERLDAITADPLYLLHRKPKESQKQDNVLLRLILKGKYKFAIEKLNDFLSEDYNYAIHRIILKNLLSQIINTNNKYKIEILEKTKQKRYRELVVQLEEISLTRSLRSDELGLLNLTNAIISIYETGEYPLPIDNDASQVSEAIQYYDYQKALNLETEFLISKDIPLDKSAIYLLLVDINQLIKNINRLKENNVPIKPVARNAKD